ncbi:MAG: hypothetical protein K2X99_06240 [Gemmatimonadaceae bacterium]|nr:hypothetical protein [Gemmatimonadaceae bacterium]
MTDALVLLDDARADAFAPFALTRPISTLRAGATTIEARWRRLTGIGAASFVCAPALATFDEAGDRLRAAPATLAAGTIVALSRFAPALGLPFDEHATRWEADARIVAVRLARDTSTAALRGEADALASFAAEGRTAAIIGWWLDRPWDAIRQLNAMLIADLPALSDSADALVSSAEVVVLGEHPVWVEPGAYVEPFVVFDTTSGPVLLRSGARVHAFTRIDGPTIIGRDSHLLGGRIRASSIGPHCRVHGELSQSILCGYANKGHEGFVGHSILGRWVNLGAGTITSNLKNSYGTVSAYTPEGMLSTGMQFLGALIGDHTKCAIGTRLMTGTVLGAGTNVFGDASPARATPPFCWGADGRVEIDRFLEVAVRVMARRDRGLSEGMRTVLRAAHAASA